LVDVQHANLVKLFELAAQDETLYFSMELVDGVDFLEHVANERATEARTESWPPKPRSSRARTVSAARLRAALPQLVGAVQALHDARKLHCDVKPTNVLVDGNGRLVLLDFGLIANLDEAPHSTLGTPGYMAPEQVAGTALTEASDWYGVGAILHEAITGRLPQVGVACETTVDELRPLAALCDALLDPVPANRPSGRDVLSRVGATGAPAARSSTRLFGREVELARLGSAWTAVQRDGSTRVARIVGASGLGKTALVEHAVQACRDDGAWLLAARCYEQESVPYKALDGAIDALAELLPHGTVVPGVLARVFPVLRPFARELEDTGEELQTARRRAFQALRELLVRADRPVVLVVDDAQWGDVDSARLLAELVRPPDSPRMLVLVTYRADTGDFLAALDEQSLGVPDERIELAELTVEDARRMAAHLTGGDADAVAREAAGNPLFIQQLAAAAHHQRGRGLGEVILARVEALDADARRLVQTIALAAGPIDEDAAVEAAQIEGGAARAAMRAVRQARLVTARSAAATTTLEPAHDRVREAVAAALAPEAARAQHLRIANTLLARPAPDPDALVHHLRRGGDLERTRVHARVAAERAEHALAIDRAAAQLALVLELGGEDRAQL
ncbi:MAG: AAA family ATPase, partial [Kofleriaceae bacterium]